MYQVRAFHQMVRIRRNFIFSIYMYDSEERIGDKNFLQ